MAKDIGYLDEEEVANRKIPPPGPIFLEPPMHAQDPRDRDIRLRQQLIIDEERKLAAATAKDYREKFASDYPKAIAIVYGLVSETIRKDLSRTVENAVPTITNNKEAKYRKIRERLRDKWGPNSQKDAEELRRKLTNLQGDARGWDIYLIALDDIIQVLAKTAKRDSANNPSTTKTTATQAPGPLYPRRIPRTLCRRHSQRGSMGRTPSRRCLSESQAYRRRHQKHRHNGPCGFPTRVLQ